MTYKSNKMTITKSKKNLLIICLSFFFSGLNLIISAIFRYNSDDIFCFLSIILGIILFCRVPLAYFDTRKGVRDNSYVIVCASLHLVFSLIASYIFSFWWTMLIYIVEVVISISIIIAKNQFKKVKNKGNKG